MIQRKKTQNLGLGGLGSNLISATHYLNDLWASHPTFLGHQSPIFKMRK